MANVFVYIFLFILLYGAICDLISFKIPNYVSICSVLLFFPAALWAHWPIINILSNTGAGALILAVGVLAFSFNLIGAGDIKMLAASAVWFGFGGLPSLFFSVAIIGGVLSLALIVFRRFVLPASWRRADWLVRLHEATGVPYGIAICIGVFVISPSLLASGN